MSSVLRSTAVTLVEASQPTLQAVAPRVFGARVLRRDRVGLRQPISLSVPLAAQPALAGTEPAGESDEAHLSPPDLAEVREAARLEGYQAGFEQGHAHGLAAAEEQIADSIRRLSDLLSTIHQKHATFFRAAERQVVGLALQIAQKVIEREVENMPDLAVNVIRSALEEMDARTAMRVRVHPDDAELLQRRWSQVVPPGIGSERIELQPDERIQPGGGIIETTHGQVDAQLDTKLAQLGNALWTFVMDVSTSPGVEDADA